MNARSESFAAAVEAPPVESRGGWHVVCAGAGNIGSHTAVHLARLPGIARLTVIDRDSYEAKNLASQDITRREVGLPKARALARRLRRVNPALDVRPVVGALEDLPLGLFGADLVVACLDSRAARVAVNRAAFRLGVPWVDAGVESGGLLARVNAYVPGLDSPCYECAFDAADEAAIGQRYSCLGEELRAAPTNAPSSLGGLAAALQAIECRKLLGGEAERAAIGREVLIDARFHRHFVSALPRNPDCRFDHRRWEIARLDAPPRAVTIGNVLSLAAVSTPVHGELSLGVEGQVFARDLHCAGCGAARRFPYRLAGRLGAAARRCRDCGRATVPSGVGSVERLHAGLLGETGLCRSLASLGFRPGDVFSLRSDGAEAHFQIGGV